MGEGANSPYAKGPLFRDDGFDCTTYVEAILAQHIQNTSGSNFQKTMNLLRYADGNVDFFSRTHFMEYHWIPNAIKHKFISEYTLQNTKNTQVKVNLQKWFLNNKFVDNKDKEYIEKANKQPQNMQAFIPYVPIKFINADFVKDLAEFMVVFFIKDIPPNTWPGQERRQELVVHMGILKNGQLYHASVKHKKVVKIKLLDYLENMPIFMGVSFYKVN